MTKNRRHEAHYDHLNDMRVEEAAARLTPCTFPMQAFGRSPLEWAEGSKPPVWAWITWSDGPAARFPAYAAGCNDRVVCVEWEAADERRSMMAWRTAVAAGRDRAG